jgi:hypothetical protein
MPSSPLVLLVVGHVLNLGGDLDYGRVLGASLVLGEALGPRSMTRRETSIESCLSVHSGFIANSSEIHRCVLSIKGRA